jgi:uncharacterized phage-associated protein
METMSTFFDERRAAEAAAFLLHRAGGQLPLIKLMKLMYLAERESLRAYGEPLTGDRLVSMDHGPVLSTTLNHMNGSVRQTNGYWERWISDRANNDVALRDHSMIRSPEDDLLGLSDSDLEILARIWAEFGHYDRWDLVEYTHTLPEWKNPHGSSLPIDYDELLEALGLSREAAEALCQRISEQSKLLRASSENRE